ALGPFWVALGPFLTHFRPFFTHFGVPAQDPRTRAALAFGVPGGPPPHRLLTVVHGPDLVSLGFLTLVAVRDGEAQGAAIPLELFPFETFRRFLSKLCLRPELDKILLEIGAAGKPYVSREQLRDFVNSRQRDPRLNEVLFPPLGPAGAQALIDRYEPNRTFREW
ncbi:1-phosphatidylinositol 4,5-bisphosphate phosphodiesterase beta-2-like, partial [Passer montanus]|uniref:1-phosphatidylinositol 4,5-bisphosphate phosphodiesterase beta-2-like n=1 Tax=Passer montanus TaxID=9160 RepID=UPI0019606BD6